MPIELIFSLLCQMQLPAPQFSADFVVFTFLLRKEPKIKILEKSQISFYTILKTRWCHTKVFPARFHLNGHTIGFHPQTQGRTTIHVSIIDSRSESVKCIRTLTGKLLFWSMIPLW